MTNMVLEALVTICESLNAETYKPARQDERQATDTEAAFHTLAQWRTGLPESELADVPHCSKCPVST